MLRQENCVWQDLMNVAYKRWQEHNAKVEDSRCHWNFSDMLSNCETHKERLACVAGKINQQVENGGFCQWADNLYGRDSERFLRDISELGPHSNTVALLCRKALTLQKKQESVPGEYGNVYIDDFIDLDDRFYALQDEWHEEMYQFFAREDQ